MEYIQQPKDNGEECVFCSALKQPDGEENLVISRALRSFVIINRFPYTSGHLMVVPYDHQPAISRLDAATRAEMMELTSQATLVLAEVYSPQGFNLGLNIGEVAGAGIAEHVHMHIVPRWGGDTNFMSALADTRVLPESLSGTYQRVKEMWEQMRAK
jgi:ATP adenylyltransferase